MNMRTLASVAMLATIAYGCSPSTETQKEVAYTASNPFLPLWEYIPDAEPYIFEDPDRPGEMRVYIWFARCITDGLLRTRTGGMVGTGE